MQVLKLGSKGQSVRQWQQFLHGQGFDVADDGTYGRRTRKATIAFQQKYRLDADGKVGEQTLGKAMMLGLMVLEDKECKRKDGFNWPAKPKFKPLSGTRKRQEIFGKYKFKAAPTAKNREAIKILGNWESENIVRVEIPQLRGIKNAPRSGKIRFHRLAADQLVALWAAWEKAGLLDRVQTWNGSFVPRFVRGRAAQGLLSNHAFGSAFDINFAQNRLGMRPALVGQKGSVRELVPLAHKHGFYWGGHFGKKRSDGMHFEVAVIKNR